jgi:hypothetical protein
MIRPATLFWIALAGCVGYGLYHLKNEVQARENELFKINRTILAEQEAIHVLRAEWSYLNQPARLQALASRDLKLQPMKPSQLGTIATLPPLPPQDGSLPALAAVPPPPPSGGPRLAAATLPGRHGPRLN